MPPAEFSVNRRSGSGEGVEIVTPRGPISFATAPQFKDAMDGVTTPRVILDLTEVPSIDSVAVGVLVRAFVICNKSGRKLALVGLGYRVRNVLQLTGIDPLFDIFPTVEDAERGLA